jgi:hypothetical protein
MPDRATGDDKGGIEKASVSVFLAITISREELSTTGGIDMRKYARLIPSGALAAGLLLPGSTQAAFLGIDDTVLAQISVSANDWESDLFVNGGLFQSGLANPAFGTFPGEGPITFSGTWIDNGLTSPLDRTVYFVEPSNPTLVSDIFHYTLSTDGFDGTFTGEFTSSAIDGGLGPLPGGVDPANVWVEGTDFNFGAPFFSGVILTVPEPSSCILLAAALSCLVARRRG